MLVLSRRRNQRIVINDDITIVIVDIRGDKVRLGIEAPKDVTVHRQEIYDRIKLCGSSKARDDSSKAPQKKVGSVRRERTADSDRS